MQVMSTDFGVQNFGEWMRFVRRLFCGYCVGFDPATKAGKKSKR